MFTKIREIKDECPLCEGVRNLIYGKQQEKIRVRGEEIDVLVNLFYCPDGDHYFQSFNDDEERIQSAYREYRKRKGFLQPEEIRQIRKQYQLSQRDFSRLLGWGDITIHRYESGALQDDSHNEVLLSIKSLENFEEYIERKKYYIDHNIFSRMKSKILELEKEKSIKEFNLWFQCCSTAKREQNITFPLMRNPAPDYFIRSIYPQYCANKELALAA